MFSSAFFRVYLKHKMYGVFMEFRSFAAMAAFSVAVSAFAAPTVYEAEAQPGVNAGDVSADSTGAKFVTKTNYESVFQADDITET